MARRHGDFALVGACAVLGFDTAGICRRVELVFFGAGDVPHVSRAAAALVGEGPTPARFAEAGRAAAEELEPHADLHATVEYRRRVAAGLGAQALALAARRAGMTA